MTGIYQINQMKTPCLIAISTNDRDDGDIDELSWTMPRLMFENARHSIAS